MSASRTDLLRVSYIHIGVGSGVVCSTLIGNARASVRGMDNRRFHAFFVSCIDNHHKVALDMDTLSNVTFPGVEATTPRAGAAASILPEATSTQKGVSVEYVPSPDKQWYVLRTSYAREDVAADYMISHGSYVYVAKRRTRQRDKDGRLHKVLQVLTPNLIFAYLSPDEAKRYVSDTPQLSFLSYYYNHFQQGLDYKNPPLVIPQSQMLNFIRATSTQNEHLLAVNAKECRYLRDGALVRVIDGEFKGVEGRLARISGQQRIVISLPQGEITIATAYIPTAFIRVKD